MPQHVSSDCCWTRTRDSHTRIETWTCLRSARSVATPHGRRVRCLSTNASTEHAVPSISSLAECVYTGLRDSVLTSAFHTDMATGVDILELEKGRDGKYCAPPGAQSPIAIPSISKKLIRYTFTAFVSVKLTLMRQLISLAASSTFDASDECIGRSRCCCF
jgi:hypothetical protein